MSNENSKKNNSADWVNNNRKIDWSKENPKPQSKDMRFRTPPPPKDTSKN